MAYPKSEDKKIQKLSNILVKYAEKEGIEFAFGGHEIYPVEAFSFFGGLSLFLIEAKEVYEKLYNNLFTVQELMGSMGKKIKEPSLEESMKEADYLSKKPINKIFPIEFHQKENDTFFGFIPRINQNVKSDFLTIAHFTHYSLEEYLKVYQKNKMLLIEGKIPLDPLYEKMINKINNNQIVLEPMAISEKTLQEN